MRFLVSLFEARPQHRSFALLDRNGHCQAFKQCSLQPMDDGWVEIEEIRLNWLHKPLACQRPRDCTPATLTGAATADYLTNA
jgi:hypothetical protein